MKHDGTLENCPFRVPLYIHVKAPIEQLLRKNHKHVSIQKDFNKNNDTSKNICPLQAKIACPCPKLKSVRFDDSCDRIHNMDHNLENNNLIDTQEQDM